VSVVIGLFLMKSGHSVPNASGWKRKQRVFACAQQEQRINAVAPRDVPMCFGFSRRRVVLHASCCVDPVLGLVRVLNNGAFHERTIAACEDHDGFAQGTGEAKAASFVMNVNRFAER
jgi:hypothetical protein